MSQKQDRANAQQDLERRKAVTRARLDSNALHARRVREPRNALDFAIPAHKKAEDLIVSPPTAFLDIKIGAVTYYTTVNEMVDMFLNLLSALSPADLVRLAGLGAVAENQHELLAQPVQQDSAHLRDSAQSLKTAQSLAHKQKKKKRAQKGISLRRAIELGKRSRHLP